MDRAAGPGPMAAIAQQGAIRFGDGIAGKRLRDGEWIDVSYSQMWDEVGAAARGLIALGVGAGDRVAVSMNTRYEFAVADLAINAAGGVVVPVYPTNSAEEAEWVIGDSGAVVAICENAEHVAKVESVRDGLPELRELVVADGDASGALTVDELMTRGDTVDAGELDDRIAAVAPGDPCLIIYTSGTTGKPKGVVLSNRGFAAARASAVEMDLVGSDDVIYLFLPLAHVFGQLIMAIGFEVGATVAFWGGDVTQLTAELGQVSPTVLPSVPRIFEKVYAAATAMIPPDQKEQVAQALAVGLRVRQARERGDAVSDEDAAAFAKADNELFPLVRGIFGGRLKLAISGAAPISPEILEFFYATGVPVMEGWGMTETTGIGTVNLPSAYRFGSIGKAIAGADIRVADDGEIEMAGPMLLTEYWRNPEATANTFTDDGYLRTGDLGSIDDDGFVYITGRKKDIIITAGGKNLTPANIEGELRSCRWVSQVVMYADRKPYPVALVTLDAEEIVPWAESQGLPTDVGQLAEHPDVVALVQSELDAVNDRYARVEQIKRFKILPHDFTLENGELTPTLKLKRNVVYATYADAFEDLYD